MNPEQWLSLKWNGGSTMSDRWLNQSKIIQRAENRVVWSFEERDYFKGKPVERQGRKARRD